MQFSTLSLLQLQLVIYMYSIYIICTYKQTYYILWPCQCCNSNWVMSLMSGYSFDQQNYTLTLITRLATIDNLKISFSWRILINVPIPLKWWNIKINEFDRFQRNEKFVFQKIIWSFGLKILFYLSIWIKSS